MVNCNYENFGCMGGYLLTSIDYLMVEGTVSSTCKAYQGERSRCDYRCDQGLHEKDPYEKYYCSVGSLKILTEVEDMKREISTNGPMMFGLMIYEDFMNYNKGIYKHITGDVVSGHAMKAIGYGVDEKEGLYWIMQNQWTEEWGDKGFIKIKAGEIGIDAVGLSCMPDLI